MDKPQDSSKQEDLVITPGGPRPRDHVHPVGPGETVRRNPDGTFTVVREDPASDCGHTEEKQDA